MIPLGTVPFGMIFENKRVQNHIWALYFSVYKIAVLGILKNHTKRNRPQWYHF